jgi:catechol 2,3-dioxygenase-like lactoylglutathione lyase family enzyme
MTYSWPEHLAVGAVRFARPTGRYDAVLDFYRDDLGLPVLAQWRDHSEYDGVVFGLPGTPVQMEITQHGTPPRVPEPHPENQLVLYLRGPAARDAAVARMTGRGHRPVAAANPYWPARGAVLFEDPDGWLVVLAPWVFGEDPVPVAEEVGPHVA